MTYAVKEKEELSIVPKEENLETLVLADVTEKNISSSRVIYELAKDIGLRTYEISKKIGNGTLTVLRHIVFGALPRNLQEKLARKYNDSPNNYTFNNVVAEIIFYPILGAFFALQSREVEPMLFLYGCVIGTLSACRILLKPYINASPVTLFPYYLVKIPYLGIKALKKIYDTKKEELENRTKIRVDVKELRFNDEDLILVKEEVIVTDSTESSGSR